MKTLAIIPARGGSKRIPGKNIKHFIGKPIIYYSIDNAIKSKLFDEVMVSTDDVVITNMAKQYHAQVPFIRSNETANDFAPLSVVIEEVLHSYLMQGKEFDFVCCLLPTAPLVTISRILESFELLKKNNFDSVFPVVRFSYPIQRALKIENNQVSMIWPENMLARSQDLMPAYHDSGQFYWLNVKRFLESKKIFAANSGVIVLSELEVQDIDTEDDWKIAEIKFELLNKQKV